MKDHLIFDVTNASTILDSDSVGSFTRANDGTLITKHSISESLKASLITQGLVFKSKLFGAIGNTYSFTVVDTGGAGPLSYTEVAGDIVLDLVGLTPTRAQVVTLLMTTTPNSYVDVSAGIPTGNVIVAAQQDLSGGEDTNFHKHLDVYAALADGEGNPITSTGGALDVNIKTPLVVKVDLDGVYNNPNNLLADSVGNIFNTRAASPDITGQVERATVGLWVDIASGDLNKVHALDVNSFLMALDATSGAAERLTVSNANGGLNVNVLGTATVNDAALADIAIIAKKKVLAVANTAETAVTSALALRKYLSIYNNDNNKIFIGGSGVDAANGYPVSPGSYIELRAGVNSPVYYVGSTGKLAEIRTLELS